MRVKKLQNVAIKRIRFDQIDILPDVIDTTKAQARQTNINKNITELAQSIETQGLFSPVLLIDVGNNKYELIAGQRRMKAHRDILSKKDPKKFGKIDAFLYENNMQEWEKKSISINENFTQEEMVEEDKIAAVTACYNEFRSIKITAEKQGISKGRVSNYVKYARLPTVLKKLKDDGKATLKTALDTANLFDLDSSDLGGISEDDVKICALEMEKLSGKQKNRVKEIKKDKPKENVVEIIHKVRDKKEKLIKIVTEVASDTYARVEVFKNKEKKKSVSLAASELIEDGLDKNKI